MATPADTHSTFKFELDANWLLYICDSWINSDKDSLIHKYFFNWTKSIWAWLCPRETQGAVWRRNKKNAHLTWEPVSGVHLNPVFTCILCSPISCVHLYPVFTCILCSPVSCVYLYPVLDSPLLCHEELYLCSHVPGRKFPSKRTRIFWYSCRCVRTPDIVGGLPNINPNPDGWGRIWLPERGLGKTQSIWN